MLDGETDVGFEGNVTVVVLAVGVKVVLGKTVDEAVVDGSDGAGGSSEEELIGNSVDEPVVEVAAVEEEVALVGVVASPVDD